MGKHLNQAHRNIDYLRNQCKDCCDKFFDWKVIAAFYVGYHCIQALAESKGINIGNRHYLIAENINPRNPNATMPISQSAYNSYTSLRQLSESARYNGYDNLEMHEEQNFDDFKIAFDDMNFVIKYCKGRGLAVNPLSKSVTLNLLKKAV